MSPALYFAAVIVVALVWAFWPIIGPGLKERYRRRVIQRAETRLCTWDPQHTLGGVRAVQKARMHDSHGTFVMERYVCADCARRAENVSHAAPTVLEDV